MPVCIAVSDSLPLYRQGLVATLAAAGFGVEAPTDLMDWAGQEPRRAVILTLETSADWVLLERLQRVSPEVMVVAVLPDASVPTYVRAIVAGAAAAVPRDAAPATVLRVFEDAVKGVSALPQDVVAALAAPHERSEHVPEPSEAELAWLRGLAEGVTVAQLAERHGYSERAMFRLLRGLYAKLAVRNRTGALMLAQRRGWL